METNLAKRNETFLKGGKPLKIRVTGFFAREDDTFSTIMDSLSHEIGDSIELIPVVDKDLHGEERINWNAPGVILIATGGVEHHVLKYISRIHEPIFLLSTGEDNSMAASLEVMAALRNMGRDFHFSPGRAQIIDTLRRLAAASGTMTSLSRCKLGIIGPPSDWLVASAVDTMTLENRWGIRVVKIPMQQFLEQLESIEVKDENPFTELFLKKFNCWKGSEARSTDPLFHHAAQIYTLLKSYVEKYELSALTLNCFPLTNMGMTACLALAALNHEGIISGCEGDVATTVSMMISRALLGVSSFMANVSWIDSVEGDLELSHCTIDPSLVSDFELDTHFETNQGIAIRGRLKTPAPVTLFRLGGMDLDKWFIASGSAINNLDGPHRCRTGVRIRCSREVALSLLQNPLGNHMLLVPGQHYETISFLRRYRELASK
ncbi:MAG: hypothetical protein CVV64_18180 [Candidatus Wallbacteria bacterium HGW-Wallbacteria-1]|uniref:Fucose isomerase n=1 Tax=Candidatus Wallbacteria bacterium HGW-Wallbacteria-1 TaxID=2013854 RepID=A0A2N1PJP8_9BACT|nr:MAG: hypothetical protein CVV64_18180 [Candidatus Wallbacteria bacterium HGW-Wallbacteria-1]